MESDRRPLIKLHINVIIGFWSFLVYVGVFVTSFIRPEFFGAALPFIRIGFTLLIIIAAGIEGAEVKVYRQRYLFFKSLEDENFYTLGHKITFFNLEAFRNKVHELRSKSSLKEKNKYVMVFRPTSENVLSGTNKNRNLQRLNYGLATFINNLMVTSTGKPFSRKNAVYAFDRNNFLFFLFTDDETDITSLMSQISDECYRLVNEENIKVFVQPFFGICKVIKNESSLTALIEKALIAKTHAEETLEQYNFYKESFISSKEYDGSDIDLALTNNEFIPYYQPKVSIKNKKPEIVSCEALARWKTAEGVLLPAKFIDRAYKSGLLNRIDLAIFEAAMKDLSDSLKRGRRRLRVSVNFSLDELFSEDFVKTIKNILEKYSIPPTLLEIEITETTTKQYKFKSANSINQLKDLGISILLDDFGSRFSQIDMFRTLNFDGVKIDKYYTDRIVDDLKTRSIVEYMVQFIHKNDMDVIVEGVETKEQVDILRKMHVDIIQGFYFSRPLSYDEYQNFLKDNPFEKKEKGSKR